MGRELISSIVCKQINPIQRPTNVTIGLVSQNAYGSIRLAKLSEGQIVDGKLECLYHGWQFDGEGKCVKIPQVSPLSHLTESMDRS
jgi:hypothetical protein